jgi:SPP1 family predicted phage head-tail adaptor
VNIDLNKRCRIEQKQVVQDSVYGTQTITWTLLAVVWCQLQDVLPSRSESVKNGMQIASNQTRFRCRWRNDIDSSMRLTVDGVTYQIIGGPSELGKREYVELMLERYSNG